MSEAHVRSQSVSIATDQPPKDPPPWMRWLVLFLSCWIMFGNYYAYDNPSALNSLLKGWMGDHSNYQFRFNLLYSVYSFPNIVLPLAAGRLMDRFGANGMLNFLSALVCCGQTIMCIGVWSRMWPLMFLGRFIFGLGGESLAVAQARLVTRWFEGRELALAIGLNLSVARLGTVFNNNLSPVFAQKYSVSVAVFVGLVSCVLSFICTMACIGLDRHYHQDMHTKNSPCSGRFRAHPVFWILALVCFLEYGCMVPYNNIASEYLQSRYFRKDILAANAAMSLPDSLAIALVPIFGVFVDKKQKKLDVIFIGGMCFLIGHWLLGTMKEHAYIPLSLLGISYSSMLAFWPCVPNLVTAQGQAMGYGILTSAFNTAVSLIPLAVPFVISMDEEHYGFCGPFFSALAAIAVSLIIVLYYTNGKYSLGLNRSNMHSEPVVILSGAGPLSIGNVENL